MNTATHHSLHGAHIVVFGGSTGIGLATGKIAKSYGATVTLVGRTPAKLEAAAAAIGADRTAVADIGDRHSVEAVFETTERVDHLVITAGSLRMGRLADTDPDQMLAELRERIAGPLYAIKAALPRMPLSGSIVLTGGQLSDRPSGSGTAMVSSAVRGIEGLGRALALELKPIRVNVISPGFIDTPLFDSFGAEGRTAILRQVAEALPGGRIGRADEVGEAIAFLLGNGYMNGEVLHVDGGGRFV